MLKAICVCLFATAPLAGCGGGDKAGGAGAPLTLRIATDDPTGRRSGEAIATFTREVAKLSHGRIRIKPAYRVNGPADVPDYDQRVARSVIDGRMDMAVVPTRAWDDAGVTTLQPLQAPFLVTSQALLYRVVTGAIGRDMLAGLERARVHGLALVPDGLRHPFGTRHPLIAPEDFQDRTLRVPRSRMSDALMRALGAKADPIVKAPVADGAESDFALASGFSRTGIATGNVTLFAKVQSLVIGRAAWERLSDAQRSILARAAQHTRDALIRTDVPEDRAARLYCQRGGRVVLATDGQLAALTAAAQPVYEQLVRDAATRGLITRIRALTLEPAATPVAPVGACLPPPSDASVDSRLIGTWRVDLPYEDGIKAGLDPELAASELGVQTIVFKRGTYDWTWRSRKGLKRCDGRYELSGDRIRFLDPPECSNSTWEARFTLDGDALHWRAARTYETGNQQDQLLRELLNGKPWRRIR